MSFITVRISRCALIGMLASAHLIANSQTDAPQKVSLQEFCAIYTKHVRPHYQAVYDAWHRDPMERDATAATKFWAVYKTAERCKYFPIFASQMKKMGYQEENVPPFVVNIRLAPEADVHFHIIAPRLHIN